MLFRLLEIDGIKQGKQEMESEMQSIETHLDAHMLSFEHFERLCTELNGYHV